MKTISAEYFHDICLNYFQKRRSEEIKNIFKIETTMEKWFQCEILLSFVQKKYEVFSSEIYNEKYGEIEDKTKWDSYPDDWKIVTSEASVYNDSRKKADIVIEKDDESIVSEIKLIWMYDEVCKDELEFEQYLYKILLKNEVFEDAKKMQGLAQSFNCRCLTIFASIDKKCFVNTNIDMKEIIERCFEEEKEGYEIKNILCDKITSYETKDYSHFYEDHKEYKHDIFIINIELNKI
jgi:hypothetical protein